jgi:hypothetical protein
MCKPIKYCGRSNFNRGKTKTIVSSSRKKKCKIISFFIWHSRPLCTVLKLLFAKKNISLETINSIKWCILEQYVGNKKKMSAKHREKSISLPACVLELFFSQNIQSYRQTTIARRSLKKMIYHFMNVTKWISGERCKFYDNMWVNCSKIQKVNQG